MVYLQKWLSIVVIITFLLFACNSSKDEKKDAPKQPATQSKVDAYIVAAATINNDIEVPGSLAPFEETNIQPEVSGKITGIYFKEGAMVSKGSLLVKLYDADLQAQLKKLQVQLAISKKTEERQAELLKINGISQQDYDLSLLSVKNLQADIDILQTNIGKTSLVAPFSGKTGFRNVSIGAYINPQTIVTTIREVNQLKLQFTVPERYSSKMATGGAVHFKIDGSNDMFPATILATENDIAEDTRSMKVKAIVNSRNAALFAGAFAKVQLSLGKNQAALMIPTQAIIPQARGKKVMAYRSGLASLEAVTTGVRDTAMIEITSGLKEGDTVLISGLLSTKPKAKVQLNTIVAAKKD
jgi:membrane fusion protein (multidrug efflux system)